MATTHTHPSQSAQQRNFERREERTSYAAVWALLAIALIAAVAYGFYAGDDRIDETTISPTQAQAVTPVPEGTTSNIVGTGPVSNELTPSTNAPGTPDTTTTESSSMPTDGIQ